MASEIGRGQTGFRNKAGVRTDIIVNLCSRTVLERPIVESENLVGETQINEICILSTYRHVESVGKTGGPSSKPKYYSVTDSEAVL